VAAAAPDGHRGLRVGEVRPKVDLEEV